MKKNYFVLIGAVLLSLVGSVKAQTFNHSVEKLMTSVDFMLTSSPDHLIKFDSNDELGYAQSGCMFKYRQQINFGALASTGAITLEYSNMIAGSDLGQVGTAAGTFDFYLNDSKLPFASVPVEKGSDWKTILTATIQIPTMPTGINSVYGVWNGHNSNLFKVSLMSNGSKLETVPFVMPFTSDGNLKIMAAEMNLAGPISGVLKLNNYLPTEREKTIQEIGWCANNNYVNVGQLNLNPNYIEVAIETQARSEGGSFEVWSGIPASDGSVLIATVLGKGTGSNAFIIVNASISIKLDGTQDIFLKWLGHEADVRSISFRKSEALIFTELDAAITSAATAASLLVDTQDHYYPTESRTAFNNAMISATNCHTTATSQVEIDLQTIAISKAPDVLKRSNIFSNLSLISASNFYGGVAGSGIYENGNQNYGYTDNGFVVYVGNADLTNVTSVSVKTALGAEFKGSPAFYEIYVDDYTKSENVIGQITPLKTTDWNAYTTTTPLNLVNKPIGLHKIYVKWVQHASNLQSISFSNNILSTSKVIKNVGIGIETLGHVIYSNVPDAILEVYSLSGKLIKKGKRIQVDASGLYIVIAKAINGYNVSKVLIK